MRLLQMEKDLQYYKDICSELEAIFEMAFDQITVADGNGMILNARVFLTSR